MKKWLLVVAGFVCLLLLVFAVPPLLSAPDTLLVLLGFLLFGLSIAGAGVSLGNLIRLLMKGDK